MDSSKMFYDRVESLANKLKQSAIDMENILDSVDKLFFKVGEEGIWSGTAAGQTKEQFDTLSNKFPQFSSTLKQCSDNLNTAVKNYREITNNFNK